MGFWLWTTLCFAAIAPPSLEQGSAVASGVAAHGEDAQLEAHVRSLAQRVRNGEGAAAHQLGDLSLSRGNKALATAWYLKGAELGDADARAHYEWVLGLLTEADWAEVDHERARLTRWLDGARPSGWLPLEGRPVG